MVTPGNRIAWAKRMIWTIVITAGSITTMANWYITTQLPPHMQQQIRIAIQAYFNLPK